MSAHRYKGEIFADRFSQRLLISGVQPCHYEGQSIKRMNENECNFLVKCHHSLKSIKGVTSCTVIGKELRKYYDSLKILVRTQMRFERNLKLSISKQTLVPHHEALHFLKQA
jgi:hypothetical protein